MGNCIKTLSPAFILLNLFFQIDNIEKCSFIFPIILLEFLLFSCDGISISFIFKLCMIEYKSSLALMPAVFFYSITDLYLFHIIIHRAYSLHSISLKNFLFHIIQQFCIRHFQINIGIPSQFLHFFGT